eukprot:jgi/Mesvir1/3972/Mv22721-RA.1
MNAVSKQNDIVNFWVRKIQESAAVDGKITIPSERDIALESQLGRCDEYRPCDRKVVEIRKGIIEKLVDDAKPKSLKEAMSYWTFKMSLGAPVPSKEQILAKGIGEHPCLQAPDKCDKEMEAMVKYLETLRKDKVFRAKSQYNMYETQLRASFQKELENASKLKTQGMGGNSAFYVACHGSKTDPLDCHFEYDELCRKARMSGVDCDANSKALENAIKKELGLPTVSISPGEQRVPGVLEPGGDVYKQWYSIPRENNTDRSIPDVLKAALDIEKASVPETIQKEPEDGSVSPLGYFEKLPVELRADIMEKIADVGYGDAALFGMASKSMMSEMWPVLRSRMFKCSARLDNLILDEWKGSYSFKDKTAVRLIIYDAENKNLGLFGVTWDLGNVDTRFPDDLSRILLDWRAVVPFLRNRPGIDVLIFDSACAQRPGQGTFYFEYAVLLALAHVKRWIGAYKCDTMIVFPDRKARFAAFNIPRPPRECFSTPFSRLMMANNNRFLPGGAKVLVWGTGVQAPIALEELDPTKKLVFDVPPGTMLQVDGKSFPFVENRLPRENQRDIVVCNTDPDHTVHVRDGSRFGNMLFVGVGVFVLPVGRSYHFTEVNSTGDDHRAMAVFNGNQNQGRGTTIVTWGDMADITLASDFVDTLDNIAIRAPSDADKGQFLKNYLVVTKSS